MDPARDDLLGVVLAGGESRRFGMMKAVFPLLGRPMARWALDSLEPWTSEQVVIANADGVAEALRVPGRPDLRQGLGPLGGLQTALTWALETGKTGVFLLACDLPLVPAELVGRILELWPREHPAVVPGSDGPRGFEPLCAAYHIRCLPGVEEVLRSGRRSMEAALRAVDGHRLLARELGPPAELGLAFTNVNTLEEAERAEAVLRDRRKGGEG